MWRTKEQIWKASLKAAFKLRYLLLAMTKFYEGLTSSLPFIFHINLKKKIFKNDVIIYSYNYFATKWLIVVLKIIVHLFSKIVNTPLPADIKMTTLYMLGFSPGDLIAKIRHSHYLIA